MLLRLSVSTGKRWRSDRSANAQLERACKSIQNVLLSHVCVCLDLDLFRHVRVCVGGGRSVGWFVVCANDAQKAEKNALCKVLPAWLCSHTTSLRVWQATTFFSQLNSLVSLLFFDFLCLSLLYFSPCFALPRLVLSSPLPLQLFLSLVATAFAFNAQALPSPSPKTSGKRLFWNYLKIFISDFTVFFPYVISTSTCSLCRKLLFVFKIE